jgi:uncharacterized membrane protein
MEKTSTGLNENVAGLLCYVLGGVSGIIFILLEQQNKFVRFHAFQSTVVFGAFSVASAILGWIPILGNILIGVIWIVGFILWIVLMIKAYQGVRYKLPWAGDMAERWAG